MGDRSKSPSVAAPGLRPTGPWRLGRLAVLSFITGFSGAMMPGSFLAATLSQTAAYGFNAVLGLLAGHALLELALVALLVLGLRGVLARPRVRGTVGIVGGVALVSMSVDMIYHAGGLSLALEGGEKAVDSWPKLMLLGVIVSLANPYFTGWWATIGAGQLATMAPKTPGEYLTFYVGHQSADVVWYGFVAMLVVTGSRWLTDSVYQGLIVACGVILAALGGWFFITGLRLWKPGDGGGPVAA